MQAKNTKYLPICPNCKENNEVYQCQLCDKKICKNCVDSHAETHMGDTLVLTGQGEYALATSERQIMDGVSDKFLWMACGFAVGITAAFMALLFWHR